MNMSLFPFDKSGLAKFYGVSEDVITCYWDYFFHWRDRLLMANSPNIYEENFLIGMAFVAADGNYLEVGIDEGATFKMINDFKTRLNIMDKILFGIERHPEKFSVSVGSIIYWNTNSIAIPNIKNDFGKVGCVFIDGDHNYEGCALDVLNCCDLIQDGGFMCFHDTHLENGAEGVRKVIADFKLRNRWKYVEAHFRHGVTVFKVNKKNMVKKNGKDS